MNEDAPMWVACVWFVIAFVAGFFTSDQLSGPRIKVEARPARCDVCGSDLEIK